MSTVTTPAELSPLHDLIHSVEPIASVYFGGPTHGPWPEHALALRCHTLGLRLAEQGADPCTVAAVTDHLVTLADPYELAMFASAGVVRLIRHLPGADPAIVADRADFGAPARLLPVLAWLQSHPAYVVVIIDHAGADVTPVRAGALNGTTVVVPGPDDEIEQNAPGGISQPRYHRRAVDSWRHNASAAATAVAREIDRIDAGLLLLSGDGRSAQMFRENLAHGPLARLQVHTIPGGRSPDGSRPARRAAVAAAVRSYVDQRSLQLRDRVIEGRGSGHTVDGAEHTLAALAEGRVETLLATDDPADSRRAWFGSRHLGARLLVPGDSASVPGRLVDVATRAALLTGAEVRVLSPTAAAGLADNIGALCRFG